MTNIALDTNIWIYLTKDTFFELWIRFKSMKINGEIRVLINEIIFKEWERNKEKTINSLCNSIKAEYKSALNLANYFNGEDKEIYLKKISEYKDESNRIKKAKERVEEIEAFMKSCEFVKISEEQLLFIAKLASNKKPPFQNNKNNFNDALILRNISEFIECEYPNQFDLIYVSNNPDDFIDKETKEVYPELFENLNIIKLRNVTELGEALKLAPELIEEFDEWLETQLDNLAMRNLDYIRGK